MGRILELERARVVEEIMVEGGKKKDIIEAHRHEGDYNYMYSEYVV